MPINDPKNITPEQIASEFFSSLFGGAASSPGKPKATEPAVDNVKEVNRLLKKAEQATPSEAATLLQIADRHIRIIDLALASQR